MNKDILILIVEDDDNISVLIQDILFVGGYKTKAVFDGLTAVELINSEQYDLVLLDIMLPGIDGFQVMEKIENKDVPVIFLTAKNAVADKVRGLRNGAEDYIVKPFEAMELLARVEVILRRSKKVLDVLSFYEIKMFVNERKILLENNEIILTAKEFDLLKFLIINKGLSFSREQLLDRVWGESFYGQTRTVDTHIAQLRKKCNLHSKLITITKYGYRLEA